MFRHFGFIFTLMDILLYPFWVIYPIINKLSNGIVFVFRYLQLRHFTKKCGNNVLIGKGTILRGLSCLEVGNNVSIRENCYIDAAGGISIGNDVSIAHGTTIMSYNHKSGDQNKPIKYSGYVAKPVLIEDDVWIASDVKIMAGVTIHSRCIIAAGAVVTHDCLSNGLYAGVPAKRIKDL